MTGQQSGQDLDLGIWGFSPGSYLLLCFMLKGTWLSLQAGVVRRVCGQSGNELERKAVLQPPLWLAV